METFILGRWKKRKEMGKPSLSPRREDYSKAIFTIIKNMDLLYKFMKMAISTLVISSTIRNTEKVNFIGLVLAMPPKIKHNLSISSTMMDSGGVAYPMDKEFIKKLMVINY